MSYFRRTLDRKFKKGSAFSKLYSLPEKTDSSPDDATPKVDTKRQKKRFSCQFLKKCNFMRK